MTRNMNACLNCCFAKITDGHWLQNGSSLTHQTRHFATTCAHVPIFLNLWRLGGTKRRSVSGASQTPTAIQQTLSFFFRHAWMTSRRKNNNNKTMNFFRYNTDFAEIGIVYWNKKIGNTPFLSYGNISFSNTSSEHSHVSFSHLFCFAHDA